MLRLQLQWEPVEQIVVSLYHRVNEQTGCSMVCSTSLATPDPLTAEKVLGNQQKHIKQGHTLE